MRSAEPWDTQWAAGLATQALMWLARNYPECAGSDALREHEDAAYGAAMDGETRKGTGKPSEPTWGAVGTRP
jgi:hypothetical protein